MNIPNIQLNKSSEAANRVLVLRDGNIVVGKITKIYSNQQAEIQIGNHKVTAKVLTPLTIGERYFFQVQQNEHQVQLKVIGNALKQNQTINVTDLLQRLGLKVTKQNIQFVQSLINEKIPFNQAQISQALRLLEGLNNSLSAGNSQQILQHLIANKLPITESVYQSLLALHQSSVSDSMNELFQQFQKMGTLTEAQKNLYHMLNFLLNKEKLQPLQQQQLLNIQNGTLIQNIFSKFSSTQQQTLFQLVQQLGLVSSNISFTEWNIQLQQALQMTSGQSSSTTAGPQLFNQSVEQILQEMSVLVNNRTEIQTIIQSIMNTFFPSESNQQLTISQHSALKNIIQQQLFPLLPEKSQHQLQTMISTNQQQLSAQLHSFLTMLSHPNTVDLLHTLSTTMINNKWVIPNSEQGHFLSIIHQYAAMLGLSDEFQLAEQIKGQLHQMTRSADFTVDRQAHSIKSLLLQIIQQGNGLGATDKALQLLHFINGMQLQSIQESPHLFQALLQLPGDKFGAFNDITMQFEGQKMKDGKLNPEFCRILFVLNLANIDDTIIDMHVQKRMISMTIFNDKVTGQSITLLEKPLRNNLESLNFQLSSIKIKPLKAREETGQINETHPREWPQGEGIEFFV